MRHWARERTLALTFFYDVIMIIMTFIITLMIIIIIKLNHNQ